MTSNNSKKKAILVGLGLFWAAAITAVGVTIPFVIKNNQSTVEPIITKSDETEFVKTSLINNNEHQIQIKVTNLNDYVGQWLKVEYKPQNTTNVTLTASEATLSRSFYVRNTTEVVAIGGLVPNIKYDYFIKNKDGKTLSSDAVFWTYSKAELNTESGESSISFISSELNKEYLANSLVLRYKPFTNSVNSSEHYNNTKELAVDIQSKELEGRVVYTIAGTIGDLAESTPYVISLHIRGQEGTIANPIIVWTRGNNAKIIATNVTTISAKAQVSGLDDYIETPNPLVSFSVQYAEVGKPDTIEKMPITLGDDAVVELPLVGLKHNTQYSMTVIKLENEIEEIVTKETLFWTKPEPFIKSKTFETIETSWRKSDVNAMIVVSGLASKGGQATDSLNSSDLQIVAVEVASADAAADFGVVSAKKFDLGVADTTDTDDYATTLTNLVAGKMYAIQVFEKTDTTFSNPMLAENFVNTQMPTLFSQETLDLTENSVKVKIKNINNYKSNETILRYWKESAPNDKVDVKIEFADNATEAEVALSSLDKNTKYKFTVLPVYSQLQTDADDLLETQGEFKTFDILTAGAFEGNHFTENVKFKLSGMDSRFPTGQETKIQWRLKQTTGITVEWATPTDKDSSTFTVPIIPEDGAYEIVIVNDNFMNTWYTGADYEWRVIKTSAPNVNLIKAGTAEFNLTDDKVATQFTEKISTSLKDSVGWRTPMYENIVASGLGNASGSTVWRPMFGFTTKTQWRDFLEWLAFQEDAVINTFTKNFVNAIKIYTTNSINLTGRYTAVPYLPSGNGGDSGNGDSAEFQNAGTGNDGRFGGYKVSSYPEDAPIKPSDFMNASSKLKGYNELPDAIKYYLQGIKEGWKHGEENKGISRDNMFINGQAISKAETYASYLVKKQNLDGNFTISATDGQDSSGWTLETIENTATDTNMWANDLTGEFYVKVKATKDGKSNYYWHKISGFKKTTDAEPIVSDLSFELYTDHARSARIINNELTKATTAEEKKKVIEKYYKIRYDSIYSEGWTFVSAKLSDDGNSIELKAKLPKKVIAKGTIFNNADKQEVASTTEFSYTLSGYDLTKLPNLAIWFNSAQKGSLAPSQSGITETARYVNANWTYEQMVNRMKDAVLQGDTKITELANLIISNLSMSSDWIQTDYKMYIRVIGGEPLANKGDYTQSGEVYKILDANKNGFVTQSTLGTNDQANRLAKMVEMIQFYGAATT